MPKANEPTDDGARPQTGGAVSPLDREEFLESNRRNREQIRDQVAAKNAKKRGAAGADETEATASSDSDDSEQESTTATSSDPSRVPGKVESASRRRPGSGRGLLVLLAAVAAVLAVSTGVLAYLYVADSDDARGPDDGIGAQAIGDAKKYAVEIVSYSAGDYSALDRRIRAVSTSEFADRYITSSQDARKGNDEAKATSTGKAVDAGLVSINDDQAVVLVALDQKVTSPEVKSSGDDGITYQSRVKLTLKRDGDRWVVSDLSTV